MVEEILENLIGQFSDPLTFYRELIQNALDAGARLVQVQVTRREEPPGVIIEVSDWGEGMNRHIIADELTRLFSSSKEEDFTKIGKFGIGFVSVFAIEPELVVVDTGRDGESWRVVFDGSPTYQCLRLDDPVEGTRVRLYKALAHAEFDDWVARSLASIRYWCRYSDAPIHFNDQSVNEELTLDSPLIVRHQQPGTEAVVGLTSVTPEPYGLYNRGLTLMEGAATFWPGLAFRLKSRFLEHTLTRDNVLRDQNFDKAMRILRSVARVQLPHAFMERIGQHLAGSDVGLDRLLHEAVPFLQSWRRTMPKTLRDRPFFPTLHGPPLSLNQLRRMATREGALYIEPAPSHVTEALWQVGVPVLKGWPNAGLAEAATAVSGYLPVPASSEVAAPIPVHDPTLSVPLATLQPMLAALLHDGRKSFRDIALADFNYPGSNIHLKPCLLQPEPGEPIRLHRRPAWWRWLSGSRLLLNKNHVLVQEVLHRSQETPLLGAFALAKAVMLEGPVPDWLEARWMARCQASRPRLEESWLASLTRLLTPKREPA